jgi:hypothetical protein
MNVNMNIPPNNLSVEFAGKENNLSWENSSTYVCHRFHLEVGGSL